MKSERITFLATPEFKENLSELAARQNVSVGEVIRGRFEGPSAAEESELAALVAALRAATAEARTSLREGLAEADQVLSELRKARTPARNKARAVA